MAADRIRANLHYKSTLHDLDDITRRSNRAAMWSVREVGRLFKRTAAKAAPVYQGPAKTIRVNGESRPVVKGELKRSIRSSKNLRRHGDGDYSVVAGPRGDHVRLYAQKQERRRPFIRPAYEAALSQARQIHDRAWAKAMKKGR